MDKKFAKRLKSFIPLINNAKERNMNEADVRILLVKMLENVFGFDPIEDISAEHRLRETFVDLTIKLKGKPIYFIETKSAGTILRDLHVRQAANYAAEAGVKYALLTNLSDYWLYRIEWGQGKVDRIIVFQTSLLADDFKGPAENLWRLSKKALKKKELDKFSKIMESLSDDNLLRALVSDRVINSTRRELRKLSGELVSREPVEKKILEKFPQEIISMIKESSSGRRTRKKTTESGKTPGQKAAETRARNRAQREVSATGKDLPAGSIVEETYCSAPGCNKVIYARGLCTLHYQKQRREKQKSMPASEPNSSTQEKLAESEPDKKEEVSQS